MFSFRIQHALSNPVILFDGLKMTYKCQTKYPCDIAFQIKNCADGKN
jgi:hypothetical protein